MALATQCPHCQTTFRVAHDQLKLRAGLVRCGSCQEIFNGVEHLRHLEVSRAIQAEPPQGLTSLTPDSIVAVPNPVSAIAATDERPITNLPEMDVGLVSSPTSATSDASSTENTEDEPLARMTLMHVSVDAENPAEAESELTQARRHDSSFDTQITTSTTETEASPHVPATRHASETIAPTGERAGLPAQRSAYQDNDELDQAIDYLQRKPWRGRKKSVSRADVEGKSANDATSDVEEPNFVVRRRFQRQHNNVIRIFFALLAAFLIVSAIAQSVYQWHDLIASRVPASSGAIEFVCQRLGCHIDVPAQIDAVSIESNELVNAGSAKNLFTLTLLLRNRSNLVQRWPAVELTLLDTADLPVLRRVLESSNYLPSGVDAKKGFPQNAEQTAKINFEVSQQKVANYRVLLFYP